MLENERIINARKRNMKLYPIYKAISYDVVFVYAIKLLFLTQVKGLSASNVIFSISMYSLFRIILQFPASLIINKIKYKKCIIFSNISNMCYPLLIMLSNNVEILILAELISAITFSLKDVAEPALLNMSIPNIKNKGNIFSKIEGKGVSNYYFIEVITSLLSGLIYMINPYLPFILSIMICALATYIATKFEEDMDDSYLLEKEKQPIKNQIKQLKHVLKFIIKSKRLRALIIYSGVLWGSVCLLSDYNTTVFQDIGVTASGLGIITAILSIVAAIASKKQIIFHNRFKNKSLTYIALSCMIVSILSGITIIIGLPLKICIIIVLFGAIIVKADKAMYEVLIERYLGNFSNKEILSQIYSVNAIIRNIFRFVIEFLGASLIAITESYKAIFIAGLIGLIIMNIILNYMKTRVGLKPEEYNKNDIEMKNLN